MTLFFGWGKKDSEFVLSPTQRLSMSYSYLNVLWFLTATWNCQYQLATWTEQGWAREPLTSAGAGAFCGGTAPEVSPWKQYSLGGAVLLLVFVVALSLTFSR